MFCVWSGDYRAGDVLGGKYTVLEVMGRGSNGVTYKAEGPDGKTVAVKALSLRRMTDWKQLELFEREAQTLETLKHPGIPRYIDYLSEDTEKDRGFFLVQELAEGRSLAQLMDDGWRADEAEVTRIGIQLLEILEYLGSRRPSVTHRDVKAENVVLEGGKAGGRLFLVDFGGVQAAAAGDALATGSTVIGTYGYMAPEQFRGAASPASDLYGLGGTLLFLLSGKPPSAFPQDRLRLDFRSSLEVGDALAAVLEGLLEPLVEDRMPASDALKILKGETSPAAVSRSGGDPPGARSRVTSRGTTLEIDIPRGPLLSTERLGTASFALVWNGTTAVWTLSALAAGSVIGAAFSLPFWFAGYQVARDAFGGAFSSENLDIGAKRWRLNRGKAHDSGKERSGKTADLKGAKVTVTGYVNGEPRTQLELLEGFRKVPFGLGLSSEEQLWLAQTINSHVERLTGNKPPEQPQPRALTRRRRMNDVTDLGGPMVGGPGVFGGRVWGGPSSLDNPSFWDDSMDDDD
ncbi:kinase-like protein [Coccomyxa subellipsoidea C-169]|uniref:non-specific serine/threonine protein kinase n=1 Tax=Coccomyxa subellipsoidea (strain C-169) TaxID=574566 RepID=I0YSK3_COCSC|nr:kinase-like protein [Coccomyxa subellipsoidea C-169]EIE21372.1 kinase-like protein [Coccomyxa subellipsoidea C-169]|eukprot:XP_005645916.1 kinase-like protein [Coccomyxa subellipsoidea C-169]